MYKYLRIVAIIATLFFISCNGEQDRDTQLLEQYLQKHFNRSIEKENQTYILLSHSACAGCAKYIFERAKTPGKNFIFVLPRPTNDFDYRFNNVLIDSSNAVGRLKFHMGNVCTIKTKNGKITTVKVYEPLDVGQIFE